jgi:hypothetical protein
MPGLIRGVWLFLLLAGLVYAIAYRGVIFKSACRACDAFGGTGRRLRAFAKEAN